MSRRLPILFISAALLCAALNSQANDSIARVAAGGITFVKNDSIRMIREELEISTKTIRVRYRFLNETDKDIKETVAFPMPPYHWTAGESPSDENVRPLDSFRVWVDGQPVSTGKKRIATIKGVDVTDKLSKIGLSDTQIFKTFGDCNFVDDNIKCGLTKTQTSEIARLSGGDPTAPWEVAETAHWEQTFPARKEIEVIHEYVPFVGASEGSYNPQPDYNFLPIPDKDPKAACIDEGTRRAIAKQGKPYNEKNVYAGVNLLDVEYILGTGRNWKGPIKDFKLRIRKTSPNQIVSLCFPGKPKRIDPLTIEFSHSNFVPQDKVIVYFYTVGE